tara:strand:- start:197 stop:376 length:180 start_codon:yes stop_codon:yes gene_type:complete
VKIDLKNDTITFDSLDEVSKVKNYLVWFIKKNKRLIRDRGEEPKLIINIKNIKDGEENE